MDRSFFSDLVDSHIARLSPEQERILEDQANLVKQRIERDPHGTDAHAPGAKLDAGKNQLGLVFHGFAQALEMVGAVGTYGAQKYSPNGWMYVPDGVRRYTDAMYRHLMQEAQGEIYDQDTGLMHAAQSAWNALARLELMLRNTEKI